MTFGVFLFLGNLRVFSLNELDFIGINNYYKQLFSHPEVQIMKKMSVAFIGNGLLQEFAWISNALAPELKDIDFVCLDMTCPEIFSHTYVRSGLVVYMHDWTVGRADPKPVLTRIDYLKNQHQIDVSGVIMFISENAPGTTTALMPLKRDNLQVTTLEVDNRTIAQKDCKNLAALLKQWQQNRSVSKTTNTNNPLSTPAASTQNNTTDQSIMRTQQQRIEALEAEVKQLKQELAQIKMQSNPQPQIKPDNTKDSSKGFFRFN